MVSIARAGRSDPPIPEPTMRVQFVVSASGERWRVTRGHTSPLDYPTQARAIAAAENLARLTAERGETTVVTIRTPDGVETRRFEPESLRQADIRLAANPPSSPYPTAI